MQARVRRGRYRQAQTHKQYQNQQQKRAKRATPVKRERASKTNDNDNTYGISRRIAADEPGGFELLAAVERGEVGAVVADAGHVECLNVD